MTSWFTVTNSCSYRTFPPSAQIALPLTADLAKPEKRAQALSITLAGLTLGVLTARVLSGMSALSSDWQS